MPQVAPELLHTRDLSVNKVNKGRWSSKNVCLGQCLEEWTLDPERLGWAVLGQLDQRRPAITNGKSNSDSDPLFSQPVSSPWTIFKWHLALSHTRSTGLLGRMCGPRTVLTHITCKCGRDSQLAWMLSNKWCWGTDVAGALWGRERGAVSEDIKEGKKKPHGLQRLSPLALPQKTGKRKQEEKLVSLTSLKQAFFRKENQSAWLKWINYLMSIQRGVY